MKQKLLLFLLSFFLSLGLVKTVYAQTDFASNSAELPIATLPTLFPTTAPSPSPANPFPVLTKLDELAAPTLTPAPVASLSAMQISDIVASGSAQDYCLNTPIIMYHHTEPLAIATQLGHAQL